MCVGSEQGDPDVAAVFVEEDVVVEFAGAEEFDPVVEVGVHFFVSGSGDCVMSGLCCTQHSSLEVISRGSRLIRKAGETCLGMRCRMCFIRAVLEWRWSRDNRSATSFSFPGNHWLKWQSELSAMVRAKFRAKAECEACSVSAAKFDLIGHPKEEVLSPRLR